jgi:hypothetical protein
MAKKAETDGIPISEEDQDREELLVEPLEKWCEWQREGGAGHVQQPWAKVGSPWQWVELPDGQQQWLRQHDRLVGGRGLGTDRAIGPNYLKPMRGFAQLSRART